MVGKARGKSGQVPIQLTLRDVVSLDPTDQLKIAMNEALKGCGLSRAQVVDDMNRLAARAGMRGEDRQAVTETIIDKWVARGSRAHIIPLKLLPIFCQATGSLLPVQALMPAGSEIVSGEDLVCLRWAKAEKEKRRISREARKLAQEAGIQ
jgi:hypothetical protein